MILFGNQYHVEFKKGRPFHWTFGSEVCFPDGKYVLVDPVEYDALTVKAAAIDAKAEMHDEFVEAVKDLIEVCRLPSLAECDEFERKLRKSGTPIGEVIGMMNVIRDAHELLDRAKELKK